jgi:thymidine kinase
MAKLFFRYAAMNAGKSTALLQVAHNYEERGQIPALFTSALDVRYGAGRITSRLGVSRAVPTYDRDTHFVALIGDTAPACILVDEAQFLTPEQVEELHRLAHLRGIPVLCFGIRSDFRGAAFPGAAALLTLADEIEEIKTVCRCGKKATMALRLSATGQRITDGEQIEIGGNERYESVCPTRFYTGHCGASRNTSPSDE